MGWDVLPPAVALLLLGVLVLLLLRFRMRAAVLLSTVAVGLFATGALVVQSDRRRSITPPGVLLPPDLGQCPPCPGSELLAPLDEDSTYRAQVPGEGVNQVTGEDG